MEYNFICKNINVHITTEKKIANTTWIFNLLKQVKTALSSTWSKILRKQFSYLFHFVGVS